MPTAAIPGPSPGGSTTSGPITRAGSDRRARGSLACPAAPRGVEATIREPGGGRSRGTPASERSSWPSLSVTSPGASRTASTFSEDAGEGSRGGRLRDRDRRDHSDQSGDRRSMIDLMRAVELVLPGGGVRDAEGAGRSWRPCSRASGVGGGVGADLVGRADDRPAAYATAREEEALHRPPVVAARRRVRLGQRRELRASGRTRSP